MPASLQRRVDAALDAALDRALAIQQPVVQGYLDRLRRQDPQLSPAELVRRLERRYLLGVSGIGGASGAAAAVPGTGTAASLASGAAEIGAFVGATALYVLALAEVYGLPVADPDVRRALVLSILVGEGGAAAVDGAGMRAPHWAQVLTRSTSGDRLAGLNGRLGRLLLRRVGARQGALLIGRALPMGVGAAVGAGGNAALARAAIATARRAFGPPPPVLPPRIVEG